MTVLKPGRNLWRIERAPRFAFFRDVAGCFGAFRASMRLATQSITIVGWDIDSRTPLVGPAGEPDDGLPNELGPFLHALAERNPQLRVNLLLWDYSSIYALERESFPTAKLAWERANLVLDDCLPLGSSQHQKIVVMDDGVAFTGGFDVTHHRQRSVASIAAFDFLQSHMSSGVPTPNSNPRDPSTCGREGRPGHTGRAAQGDAQ